jgi:predicted ribosome quality control (RQC) complex YloA/Tae2 family protein
VARTTSHDELTLERRARLLNGVRALVGATVQKLWLPSSALAVLQLRIPRETTLVLADARLGFAATTAQRPTSAEGSPKSQATLRAALEGARLKLARLEQPKGGGPVAVRLGFDTPAGPRALIAGDGASLLLIAHVEAGERIVWAAAGAGPDRRPGGRYREIEEVAPAVESAVPEDPDLLRRAFASEEAAGVAARRRELEKRLRGEVRRLRRTSSAVEQDAERATQARMDRRRAELLVPHQARIPRGAREARVPDWSDVDEKGIPREVVVELDPALSASENVARWFRRAQRYDAAASRIAGRRTEVAAALARAEQLLARASAASDAQTLAAVEAELLQAPKKRRARRRGTEAPRVPYRTFRSESGARILVGRSARDNDALTFGVARGNDLWLHARGVQGSHVVVPDPGEAPDARTLGDAALLAAHFSRARSEQGFEVAWTRRKHVRKPKDAPAGSVIATQERTVRVRLSETRLAALLSSEE